MNEAGERRTARAARRWSGRKGWARSGTRAATILGAALLLAAPAITAGQSGSDGGDYRYYLAALAAADARLQLHDTPAARRWLNQAPAEHRGWEWHYLDATADRSSGSFEAHEGGVTDISVSGDGRVLATTGAREAKLWDAASGELLTTLEGHASSVWNARFSPDGSKVATVSSDGTLRVWDRAGGLQQVQIDDTGAGVAGLAWHPDGGQVATVSWKNNRERGVWGVVDIWDPMSGRRIHHFEHGIKPLASVNYAPDGSRLYVGSWDFDVGVYDSGDWRLVQHLIPPQDDIYKAVFESRPSPDGSRIAMAHADGVVRVWDTDSGELLHALHRQSEGAYLAQNDVVWFPEGERLAAASTDFTVRLWDAVDGEHLAVLHGHTDRVSALAVTPDGRTLFSGDTSGEVRRWDLEALDPARSRWSLPATGYSASVSHGGDRVASAGWGGWAVITELDTGRQLARWQAHDISGVRAAWSPDDTLVATTGNDGLVKVWDVRTATPELVFERPVEMQSLAVSFSPDGRHLVSPAAEPGLKMWSVADGSEVATFDDGEVSFSDALWHPSGHVVAVSGDDGVVRLWDPESGEVSARLEGHGRGMLRVAFSADGERLAAVSASGGIRVWQVGSAALLQEMRVSNGGQISVAFAPDGRRLVSGGFDASLHVWDPTTGERLISLPFSAQIWDVAFSRDGSRLITVPLDDTVRVLDATGR